MIVTTLARSPNAGTVYPVMHVLESVLITVLARCFIALTKKTNDINYMSIYIIGCSLLLYFSW